MSQENVEVVRSFYRALWRTLSAYSEVGGRLEDAPFADEVFAHLDEDVEWRWPLTPERFRGREGLLRAGVDFLEAVDEWQIQLEEVVDAGDHLFTSQNVLAQGKGSGVPSEQRVYSVVTIRDGRILCIEDYVDRRAALEAAGLSE